MPIYEYQCQACGEELEVLQKISEEPLRDCPACHKPALRKKVSAAGFRLKGSGWYETDFKGGKQRNVVESPKNSSSGKEKSKEKGKEKPAGSSAKPPKKPGKVA